MNLKQLIYFTFIVLIIGTTSVNKSDQCSSCTQMKSQQDCLTNVECQWNSKTNTTYANCTKKQQTPAILISFCSTVNPNNCARTSGCAYVNGQCMQFTGCSVYQLTTLYECQSINTKCVTNGKICVEATDCSTYSSTLCDNAINAFGRVCKLDTSTKTCRDALCTEADSSLNSDTLCDAYSFGCVTTGLGCIAQPLPSCSSYTGTSTTCTQMKGKDGYCEFNIGTTYCKAKLCTNAPPTLSSDQACQTYQIDCVTTGKGCVSVLGFCSSYIVTNAVTDCNGYIGIDGICEGVEGATVCGTRKCENRKGTTNNECDNYQKGCITNGIECATTKFTCNGYQGTIFTCPKYIATDGNCKGVHDTIDACTLKDCVEDSQSSYTTDAQCQIIQSWCITTGKGCVKTLQSCTTYTSDLSDGSDCVKLIGSEGKCTAGASGKCAPRACTNAPAIYQTNKECADYSTKCATTGAGCITQTSCQNTLTQLTCYGTKEGSSPCTWKPFCISSASCDSFKLQSLCISSLATIINGNTTKKQACIWDSGSQTCKNAFCTDFTGTNYQSDAACDKVFPGCVTNGQGCVDPSKCGISFKGTKSECIAFKAYCTNTDQATSTDSCIKRTCADSGLTYQSDIECQIYLPECLTKGNGCIINTQPCSGYIGTQQQCKEFNGYYNGKVQGAKCWNTSETSSACTERQCTHASGMNNQLQCDLFLSGCLYDGGTSCVDSSVPCSSYKYTNDPNICQQFKGQNGTIQCYQSTNNQCKQRECTDNITATTDKECYKFLSGCRTNGTGCVSQTIPCSEYQGTVHQCNNYFGNSIKCTKKQQCTSKSCSSKTDALNNQACITYKISCRLIQGGSTCQDAKTNCNGYILSGQATNDDKHAYCNQVTDKANGNCTYDPNTSGTCVARSSCAQWNALSNIECVNYLGTNTCLYQNNYCYSSGACNTYSIPQNVSDKNTWCKNMSQNCIYQSPNTTCITITQCEQIVSPTDAKMCNSLLETGDCQFYGSKCYTTQTTCKSYSTVNINDKSNFCSQLVADKNGTVYKCKYNSNFPLTCSSEQSSLDQTPNSCADILGPTSQQDCNQFSNIINESCNYYKNKCYSVKVCANYDLTPFNSDQEKLVFCNNMISLSNGGLCFYKNSLCIDGIECITIGTPEECVQRSKLGILCIWANNQCQESRGNTQCNKSTDIQNADDCLSRSTLVFCFYEPKYNQCLAYPSACSDYLVKGTNQIDQRAYCQSLQSLNSYCTLGTSTCIDTYQSCTDVKNLNPQQNNLEKCTNAIDVNGKQCSYISGQTTCILPEISISSQIDCDLNYTGKQYYNGICYDLQANCNSYTATGNNDDQKLTYCNSKTAIGNLKCTFIKTTTNCINRGLCNSYSITGDKNTKVSTCKAIVTTDSTTCNYIGTGSTCLHFADCDSITGATSQSDCDAFLSTCVYNNSKCYAINSTCNYTTGGQGSLVYCSQMKNSNGDFCTADSDTAAQCIQRSCNDTATAHFQTNQQCKDYKQTCKFDGIKCVDSSVVCSTYTQEDCSEFLDTDNITPCFSSGSSDSSSSDSSSSDSSSCIDNTFLCSSYHGTKLSCQTHHGKAGKCQGDSDTDQVCRDPKCSDLQTATEDSDCDSFLSGCLYNGVGCIAKSEPCSSYKGTIETCQKFKGDNGTNPCWGTSNSIGSCKVKECSDLAGISDLTCLNFLPAASSDSPPKCVTDGTKCVTYPRTCSQFTGTQDICSKLTASDGPCKSTSFSGSGPCTPNICTKDCINCGDVTSEQACNFQSQCIWASSCKIAPSNCGQLTVVGQSACVNTPLVSGSKCIWSNNICRSYICTDYDQSITTHEGCQQQNPTCTTSGAGCVTYGICSSYTSESVCSAAYTPESTVRCGWENNKCRQQNCTDLKGTTDQECDKQLKGCKSNGTTCIGPIYSCSVFSGNKNFCFSDSSSNPCIYLNDICYKFTSCSDIPYTDFENCQKASTFCVPSNQNCTSIKSCDQYDSKTSCIIGINNTICGWKSQQCVTFGLCSDYAGTSLEDCQSYSSKCVSDGTKCVDIAKCSSFQTPISCSNQGTDGFCSFDKTTNNCRLRQCSDLISSTDFECSIFIVKTGICTTDGTKCVNRAKCTEYLKETACTIGSDGIPCTFAFPVGQTSGTKSCRAMDCTEINEKSNQNCATAISGKICVSNGKSCLNQSTCSSYKNQISCNGGGTDGICAFTPVPTTNDTLAGTCELFNSCEKANKDQFACQQNTVACIWSYTTTGNTTTCIPQTCATKAIGTECYPVPNFQGTQFTICAPQNNTCVPSDPKILGSQLCYTKSQYTYTWDSTSQSCVQCVSNSTNVIVNNTNSGLSTIHGSVLGVLFHLVTLVIFD